MSCQDPSGLDATRTKTVIFDPNNLPPVFSVTPEYIDFGILHPGKTYSKNFTLQNITNNEVRINNIRVNNFTANYLFNSGFPISLLKKGLENDSKTISASFLSQVPGKYDDNINWGEYKNPIMALSAKVASVWANDIKFDDTKVGSYNLKILNVINSSPSNAVITEFELTDPDGVMIISPPVSLPYNLAAYSQSENIFITFNSTGAKEFKAQIRMKVDYTGTGDNFTDEIIELVGKGIF